MKHYVHEVPGRLRVKIPMIKNNPAGADTVRELIGGLDGVREISTTTVTGSVVAYYDSSALSSADILAVLKEHGYFDDSKVITSDVYVKNAAVKAGESVRRAVMGWVLGAALEDTGLGFLAVLI